MMRNILFYVAVVVMAALLPATAHGDDFYYCLDSAVHVAILDDFIAVQFDTRVPHSSAVGKVGMGTDLHALGNISANGDLLTARRGG